MAVRIFFAVHFLIPNYVLAQNIKVKIGVSVWNNEHNYVNDSVIIYKGLYQNNRLVKEWHVFRDSTGATTDTTEIFLESLDRIIHAFYYPSNQHQEYNYADKHALASYTLTTSQNKFNYEYKTLSSRNDTIIASLIFRNGICMGDTVKYIYANNSISILSYKQKTIQTYNNNGKLIKWEHLVDSNPPVSEIRMYSLDSLGNEIVFTKWINGKLKKVTDHFYQNGLEIRRVEMFHNPNYTISTYFHYISE